jgi:hypothetical protein
MSFYVLISLLCLVLFLALNWKEGMDLALVDLVMFTIAAFVPVVNVLFLCWIVLTIKFDFNNIPTITLIRGK